MWQDLVGMTKVCGDDVITHGDRVASSSFIITHGNKTREQ